MKKKLVALMLVSILALSTMSHAIGKESVVAAEVSTLSTSKTEKEITVDKTAHIIPGTVDEVEITLEAYIEGTVEKTNKSVNILFILDQSNSMSKEDMGQKEYDDNGNTVSTLKKSRQEYLIDAMTATLENLQKKSDDERPGIAITTFHDTAQLLQFKSDGSVMTPNEVKFNNAYQNSEEYYEQLVKEINTWDDKIVEKDDKGNIVYEEDDPTKESMILPTADSSTGFGGLKSNTNQPEGFTLANQIAQANKGSGVEQYVVFYSDGKPQLPNYNGLTMLTPDKVKEVLGEKVTIDNKEYDISKCINFTDARYKGELQKLYAFTIYDWVQSNEQADKDALIQYIEYLKKTELSQPEKDMIEKYRFVTKRNEFRDAMHASIWPMEEVYQFDQYKYDESVKAANKLKQNVKQIYSIATFQGVQDEVMHDKDNSNTLTVMYSPKNYFGASRMMQLISSNYKSTQDGGMGIEVNYNNTYSDPKAPTADKIVPVSVIETDPITGTQQTKNVWVSQDGEYKLYESEDGGDKQFITNASNVAGFTHYYNIVETPEKQPGNFYTNATTVEELYQTIIGNVSNIVDGNVVTEAKIDDTAVITDYLSDDFILPEGFSSDDVKVFVSDCKGKKDGVYIWDDEKEYEKAIAPYTRPTITIGDDTVQVKGFNFQENVVTAEPRQTTDVNENIIEDYGRKIIIKFNAKAKTEEVWGHELKTNEPNSGIFIPNNPPTDPPSDPIITFPEPDVDIYRDYTMKDNVVYLGNKVDEYYIFSDKEGSLVDGKKNHNVDIEYVLCDESDESKKYTYRVPAGKKLSEGKLYAGTDTETECTFDKVLENTAYSCTRTIYIKGSKDEEDRLDKNREPLATNADYVEKSKKANITVLKPYLPTVDIWIDNPASKEDKPSLQEVCFGNTTGSDDSKKFKDMGATDITWIGKDYLNKEHKKGTETVSKLPEIEVVDKYGTITDREYSEKDFDLQLKEDGIGTVSLTGAELEADQQYDAFPKFKVTYNTYNVEVQKQVAESDISENMSFLFDGKVTATSNKDHTTDYNVLLRNPDFQNNNKLYQASKKIVGLECTEDVFSIEEDTKWSWMYKLESVSCKDNLQDIKNDLVSVTHTFEGNINKPYKGTFSFDKIAYNEQKIPTIVFTYKNSLKSSTGLYHQISVENHYTDDGVKKVQ